MDKGGKKKGRAATPGNVDAYSREVRLMELSGEKFTLNQFGKVNVKAFADRCRFGRSVLEKGGALYDRFNADVERLGIATANDVPRLLKKAVGRQKLTGELQKLLNSKTAEVEFLKKQAEELTRQVRELKHGYTERDRILEHMLATGERFFL